MSNKIMRFKRIQCQDFMRHVALDLDLDAGLIVIRGPNGSGKSSALTAIMFALYGLTAVSGGKDIAIRTGAKDCRVELDFMLGDDYYRIERTTRNATLTLVNSGAKIANGTSAVSDWVKDNLGLDQKMFTALMFSEQGETAALLTLGAPALNAMVEKITGADFIDRVVKRASTRLTHADGQLSGIPVPEDTGEMRSELDSGRQRLDDLQDDFSRHERALAEQQQRADAAKAALSAAESNNRAAQRYQDGARRLGADLSAEGGRRAAAADALGRIPARESLAREEQALSAAQDRLSVCDRQIRGRSEADTALATARRSLERLEPKAAGSAAAAKLKAQRSAEYETASKELADYTRDLDTAESELKRVSKSLAEAICQACKRPLDAAHAVELEASKADLEARLPALRASVQGASARVGALQREIGSLSMSILTEAEEQILSEAIASAKNANDILNGIPLDIQTQYDEARKAEIEARNALSRARSEMAERERAQKQIEESDRRMKAIQDDLDALDKKEPVDLQPLIAASNEASAALLKMQNDLNRIENDYNTLEARLAALEKRIETNDNYRERRTALERQTSLLRALIKYLRDNKSRYLADTWATLTAEVSEFVSRCTDREIELIQRTPEGKFYYTQGGETRPLDGLSGGQRALAGVGMRLAMGSLSPAAAGALVLDEPSSELNDELAGVMAAELRAQWRQVILVTHRTGEEFVSDRVFVFEK